MKNSIKISILLILISFQFSCKSVDISPKEGTIKVPPKGEIRMWQNIEHSSFTLHLENKSSKNSCEAYKVSSSGNQKWISPSLLAKKSLDFTISSNGSLLLQNYSEEELIVNYTIN
ncbi:hypothetical protein OX283_006000 [Flavobacterium sp. SUN052]|uniref:hypothetical protein n=1 Tax=Flavobacterium sp. SUN052 TaxID=3002441 RepID=UPI00237D9F5A|nr:hypothetical protein [Flavobacterium sp. SUN052]MEC4004199.1 hypothetical protein [Flavobacterium sp. SUN052]